MKRWVCPDCGDGKLGPERPRRNATVRFCLTCSSKSDTLVERVCPAKERQREKRARTIAEVKQAERQSLTQRLTIDGLRIDREARRLTMLGVVRAAVRGGSWRITPIVARAPGIRIEVLARDGTTTLRAMNSIFAPDSCAADVCRVLVNDLAGLVFGYGECTARDILLAGYKGEQRAAVREAMTAAAVADAVVGG